MLVYLYVRPSTTATTVRLPSVMPARSASGILTDVEVAAECLEKRLIVEGYDEQQLKGCCYEFRVSNLAYSYDYENKLTRQQQSDQHIIQPFQTLTIVTIEKVSLDKQHFLLLFAKGSLFSIGLTPVSTAADPGFVGKLGITLTNMSVRPIRLRVGTPFVKGCFFNLGNEVAHPYVGQHGDATMSWPYPSQFHTEPDDFNSINAIHWSFLPPPLKASLFRLQYVEKCVKWIVLAFIALILVNIALPFYKDFIPPGVYALSERLLNLVGALASIVGLLLSLSLMTRKKG